MMTDDTDRKSADAKIKLLDPAKTPSAQDDKSGTPATGEVGGPEGPEPTRYGDWEKKGRCIDF